MFWNGEVTLSCPKTGLSCIFTFKEKSSENTVRAVIFADANPSDELYVVEGKIGGLVNVQAGKGGEKRPLANYESKREMKERREGEGNGGREGEERTSSRCRRLRERLKST